MKGGSYIESSKRKRECFRYWTSSVSVAQDQISPRTVYFTFLSLFSCVLKFPSKGRMLFTVTTFSLLGKVGRKDRGSEGEGKRRDEEISIQTASRLRILQQLLFIPLANTKNLNAGGPLPLFTVKQRWRRIVLSSEKSTYMIFRKTLGNFSFYWFSTCLKVFSPHRDIKGLN